MSESDPLSPELHRRLAVAAFNRTWELVDATDRDRADDDEMLRTAFASRYHWEHIGGDAERATGDWQIAHVASLMGLADTALRFARSSLDRAETAGFTGWRLASAREGMARAMAAAGDRAGRDRYVALAREALREETDYEDRELIESQLATVP